MDEVRGTELYFFYKKSLFIMNQESELKTRTIYECRYDERLKTKTVRVKNKTYE